MLTDSCWFALLFVVVLVWLIWARRDHQHRWTHPASLTATLPRLRPKGTRPRTPYDCPACRQQATAPTDLPPARPSVTPWRALKSLRGAPKRIDTQPFACPNRTCV
jgi:hypothetical protein